MTYLVLLQQAVEDVLVGRLGEAALLAELGLVGKASTEVLGTEVKGIAKRLVGTREVLLTGHKNLRCCQLMFGSCGDVVNLLVMDLLTLSKAVEQDRGWVATKIGRPAMMTIVEEKKDQV